MSLSQSILATLAYHDIFDYPLTAQEVHRYLIDKKTTSTSITKILIRLLSDRKIGDRKGYYHLTGRSKIVSLRLQRAKFSQAKLKRAQFFANILKIIPTVKLVAISGALAMANSHKSDDIDLVIITSRNCLWTSRFFANLALLLFKRSPHSSKISDKACLNIFLDESHLKISPQNLYLAHEICQMKPIWDKNGTHARFIKANRWVTKFLPNWRPHAVENGQWEMLNGKHKTKNHKPYTINYSPVEIFLKKFQLWYMHSKITSEKIGEYQLFFHPTNTGEWVMEEYQNRLRKFRLK